ncbi:hypothetical protein MLD38_016118 [Melastoma candidum]|uniref:Uncharacterized protein n=1 Tax=Melastoma candidum TaxID=119954 RepID=A0ACB9RKB9_9MYRT|nr:hypothetical protein MLD38_016118 [Melastoma candidum]
MRKFHTTSARLACSNPDSHHLPSRDFPPNKLPPTTEKIFAVPPVVFPSDGGVGPTTSASPNRQQRRVPTAPFQPPPPTPTSSAIPFLSFDIGNAGTSSSTIYTSNSHSSSSAASFDEEQPLLDELGIHPEQIWRKTKSIFNPFRVNTAVHLHNSDLSGPILLYLSLCVLQLLSGKIQFGVVLGWIVVSSIFLFVVFNMIAGKNGMLDLHSCASVIGYCMLPIVGLLALSLFIPQGKLVMFVVAGVLVMWATRVSTSFMVALADGEEEHRGLVAYACFLIYTLFLLLVVF